MLAPAGAIRAHPQQTAATRTAMPVHGEADEEQWPLARNLVNSASPLAIARPVLAPTFLITGEDAKGWRAPAKG